MMHLTPEELAGWLDETATAALAEARVESPPVDAFAVARVLGITVAEDAGQAGRARYVRLRGMGGNRPRPTVLLRPDARPERCHWALAHEIGEHLACRLFERAGIDPRETRPQMREMVANQLAGRILVPTAWYADDGLACGWDLIRLKAHYATASHELLARRMLDLPPPVIITIFDRGRQTFRRSNVSGRVPPMCQREQRCRRNTHCDGRPCADDTAPEIVQSWPIHEPDWKREIIRREVPWEE